MNITKELLDFRLATVEVNVRFLVDIQVVTKALQISGFLVHFVFLSRLLKRAGWGTAG